MSENTAYRPAGYHTITPFLPVKNAARLIDFYKEAFGAEVVRRVDGPNGSVMHAELRIGDSMLQLSDEIPSLGLLAPTDDKRTGSLVLYVPDVDATFARAIELGATEASPVADVFSGDRMGTVVCPSGHRWVILTRVEDVPDEEVGRRAREMFSGEFADQGT